MALETEIKFFELKRVEFLTTHAGKYALIKGETVFGFFDDANRAFEEGVERFGAQEFLIKQVLAEDQPDKIPSLMCGQIYAAL